VKDSSDLTEAKVKAKECAYRLLKYKERSTKEIRDRLQQKKFSSDVCNKVIGELKGCGYLNDSRFASMLAADIIKFRPGGLEFVRSALRAKGVPEETADSVVSNIERSYDEREIAYKLASVRAKRSVGLGPKKAKQRIYNFLLRRRFKKDTILEVLSQIFKEANRDQDNL
jgi:regulatory protein